MNLIIGSDHAGYKLKEVIKNYIRKIGHSIIDYGTDSEKPVDYPEISEKVGEQ